MKKLLITMLLIFSLININAQYNHSFSIGIDIANALYKGSVNDRGLDIIFDYTYSSDFQDTYANFETGVTYERFEKLNFENYGLFLSIVTYPKIKNIETFLGVESGRTHRWQGQFFTVKGSNKWFYSYGGNIGIRYKLTKRWQLEAQANYRNRLDIDKWVFSNSMSLKYNILKIVK